MTRSAQLLCAVLCCVSLASAIDVAIGADGSTLELSKEQQSLFRFCRNRGFALQLCSEHVVAVIDSEAVDGGVTDMGSVAGSHLQVGKDWAEINPALGFLHILRALQLAGVRISSTYSRYSLACSHVLIVLGHESGQKPARSHFVSIVGPLFAGSGTVQRCAEVLRKRVHCAVCYRSQIEGTGTSCASACQVSALPSLGFLMCGADGIR
jgi:hypothetical protein